MVVSCLTVKVTVPSLTAPLAVTVAVRVAVAARR